MGRKRRLRKAQERAQRKGQLYLDPEMDEIQKALLKGDMPHNADDLWDFEGTAHGHDTRWNPHGTATPLREVKSHAPAKPQINMALLRALRDTMQVKLAPVDRNEITSPITWIIGGNGITQVRKTVSGLVCVKSASVVTMPGLADQPTWGFEMVYPKLPFTMLQVAVAFLKWVKLTHDTEGLIRGYYSPELGWSWHVPEQRVSGASVEVADDVDDPGLGTFALEIHSHPGSSSTFSSVDDDNEQLERIFGCVADLSDKAGTVPNFHWRVGTGIKLWKDIDTDDVFETGEPITFTLTPMTCLTKTMVFNPFREGEFPEEWKAQVTKAYGRVQSGRWDGHLGPTATCSPGAGPRYMWEGETPYGRWVKGVFYPHKAQSRSEASVAYDRSMLPAHYDKKDSAPAAPVNRDKSSRFDSGTGLGARIVSLVKGH